MEQNLLTMEEVKQYFKVKDTRTIKKFIKQGLKYIPLGTRDYRFDPKDVEEFAKHLKEVAQQEMVQEYPVKKKTRSRTINVDYEKMKINRQLNRVV